MSVAVSSVVATEAVPGDRAGTETAASHVPAKFLVRVLASLLTEQAKGRQRTASTRPVGAGEEPLLPPPVPQPSQG